MSANSGVCIVRVEVQSDRLFLTVSTERLDGLPGPEVTKHFTDIDRALVVVRDFLAGFQPGGLPPHVG